MESRTDIREILDHICDLHGFTSHGEARRWLREARDVISRSKLTKGGHTPNVVEMIPAEGTPDLFRKRMQKVRMENPMRQLIGDDGYTRVPEPVATAEPEIHVPSAITPFERALADRQNTPAGQKRVARANKHITAKKKSVRGHKPNTRTAPGLISRPRGAQSLAIFEKLVELEWDHIAAKKHFLTETTLFHHYPAEKRGTMAHAAILNVKKRYMGRSLDKGATD